MPIMNNMRSLPTRGSTGDVNLISLSDRILLSKLPLDDLKKGSLIDRVSLASVICGMLPRRSKRPSILDDDFPAYTQLNYIFDDSKMTHGIPNYQLANYIAFALDSDNALIKDALHELIFRVKMVYDGNAIGQIEQEFDQSKKYVTSRYEKILERENEFSEIRQDIFDLYCHLVEKAKSVTFSNPLPEETIRLLMAFSELDRNAFEDDLVGSFASATSYFQEHIKPDGIFNPETVSVNVMRECFTDFIGKDAL